MGQLLEFIAAHLPGHRFYWAYTLIPCLRLFPWRCHCLSVTQLFSIQNTLERRKAVLAQLINYCNRFTSYFCKSISVFYVCIYRKYLFTSQNDYDFSMW